MVINVSVTNLTNDAASTAPAPVKSVAVPHPPIQFSPLTVVIIVIVACLMLVGVIIVIRRKRRLDRLRHSLIPFYSFDANEEEDWDSDLLQHEGGTQTIRHGQTFRHEGSFHSWHERFSPIQRAMDRSN
ncbi:uncharacterized protein LOC100168674 isoform X2 [Acyrthosiphon pisum]|uniref:Uncharacterized protein n=1 Tax=Acyrthosiphon pisum TaxID=7029 RepID=A0A8R1X1C1_ACYPI|nr:uncharacterized protein LOC100168674 isoform X2 [Acyrthosiphon pisum]|eukprot:XP_008179473.1 PREDICTED: uncharacterized protein LOC100168674 isoform X2 [Acyrthosiphon pisum]